MPENNLIKQERFSIHCFLIKITSRKFIAWLISSIFVHRILWENGEDLKYILALVIIWGVVTAIFMLGEPITKAISAAVEKAEIKFHTKLGNNDRQGGHGQW